MGKAPASPAAVPSGGLLAASPCLPPASYGFRVTYAPCTDAHLTTRNPIICSCRLQTPVPWEGRVSHREAGPVVPSPVLALARARYIRGGRVGPKSSHLTYPQVVWDVVAVQNLLFQLPMASH